MSNSGTLYLFVYGSLRSGFRSPAYDYISRFFMLIGNAKVRGKLHDMGSYPAAVPTDENSYIVGELYAVKNPPEFSWAIGQLDDYEGVTVELDETQLYRRERTEAITEAGTQPAWIYWYNGDVSGKPVVDSGDVLQYLKEKL